MSDQVKDGASATPKSSPLLDELLFNPKITATEGFTKGPYPKHEAEFKPYKAAEPVLVQDQLEAPTKVPIPRPRPDNLGKDSHLAPEISIRPKARPDELGGKDKPLESVPIPRPRPTDLDTTSVERPKPRPLNTEQKAIMQELSGFRFSAPDGTPMGAGMQAAKEVTQNFVKERNTATALPRYKEGFERAIAASDQAYFATEKTQAPIIKAAELNYGMAISRITNTIANLDLEIGKLPPDVQARATDLKRAMQTPGESESARQTFANDFKDYPKFVSATQEWLDDSGTYKQADDALTAARKPLIDAARDEALTRYVYKRAADLAGNTKLAGSIGEEALLMAQRAMEIEQKPKPMASRMSEA